MERRQPGAAAKQIEALEGRMAELEEEERVRFSTAAQIKGTDAERLYEKYMQKHLEEEEEEKKVVIADVSNVFLILILSN